MEVGVGVIQSQDQKPGVTSVEEAGRNFQRRHAHLNPDAGLPANGVVKQNFYFFKPPTFQDLAVAAPGRVLYHTPLPPSGPDAQRSSGSTPRKSAWSEEIQNLICIHRE